MNDFEFQKILKDLSENKTKDLDLSIKQLTQEQVQRLSKILADNTSLQSLSLFGNDINDIAAIHIATALKSNKTLKTLNLRDNNIGDEGASAIAKALETHASLQSLTLSHNKITKKAAASFAEVLKGNKSLQELDLGYNQIGEEGAISIGTALKGNTSLLNLNLEFNQIGNAGSDQIMTALETNAFLKYLNLQGNNINNSGAVRIALALESKKITLQSLDLGINLIGDLGAYQIAKALISNISVEFLGLRLNQGISRNDLIGFIHWQTEIVNTNIASSRKINQSKASGSAGQSFLPSFQSSTTAVSGFATTSTAASATTTATSSTSAAFAENNSFLSGKTALSLPPAPVMSVISVAAASEPAVPTKKKRF
jgi:Ran GTPase-activating protein (RanGAP) involved in mRNA processing and transport